MPSLAPLLLSIHIRLRIDRVTNRKTKFAIAQMTLNISVNPIIKMRLVILITIINIWKRLLTKWSWEKTINSYDI